MDELETLKLNVVVEQLDDTSARVGIERNDATLVPGEIIKENYAIREQLGSGGRGTVFLARDLQLEQDIAIKIWHKFLADDHINQERFRREARIAAMLDHPNIVRVRAFGYHRDMPFMAMEYVCGMSLEQCLKENGALSQEQFRLVFLPLVDALKYADNSHVLHRDIKPANIMVNPPLFDQPKLVDFGMARLSEDAAAPSQVLTKTTTVAGSPAYMSPEQCQGKLLDARSDIYSIGVTMFQALTGELPFNAESDFALMSMHIHNAPSFPKNSPVGTHLQDIVLRCLQKDPADRYQSAASLFDALIMLDTACLKTPAQPRVGGANRALASILLLTMLSFALLGVVGVLAWMRFSRDTSAPLPSHNEKKAPPIKSLGHDKRPTEDLLSEAGYAAERNEPTAHVVALYETAMQLARKNNQPAYFLDAESSLARLLLCRNEKKRGEKVLRSALYDLEHTEEPSPAVSYAIYRDVAHLYLGNGKFDKAEEYFYKALKAVQVYKTETRRWREAAVLHEIASLYWAMKDTKKSIRLLKQSVETSPQDIETSIRATELMTKTLFDEPELAAWALKVYEQNRQYGVTTCGSSHLLEAANMLALRSKYDQALKLAAYARADASVDGPSTAEVDALIALTRFSLKSGHIDNAKRYCQQALLIPHKHITSAQATKLKELRTKLNHESPH